MNEVMKEHIIQGGCTVPTPAVRRSRDYLMALGYAAAVALSASLVSLSGVIFAGRFIGPGEHFEEVGLQWAYSLPIVAILAVASMALFKYYRTTKTWLTATAFFVSNSAVVAVASFLLADIVPEAVLLW